MENRDLRFFINWFNHITCNEKMLYILLEDKDRYLKTKYLAKRFSEQRRIEGVIAIFKNHWHKLKVKK
jgi:hypothetical protein